MADGRVPGRRWERKFEIKKYKDRTKIKRDKDKIRIRIKVRLEQTCGI